MGESKVEGFAPFLLQQKRGESLKSTHACGTVCFAGASLFLSVHHFPRKTCGESFADSLSNNMGQTWRRGEGGRGIKDLSPLSRCRRVAGHRAIRNAQKLFSNILVGEVRSAQTISTHRLLGSDGEDWEITFLSRDLGGKAP